MGVIVVKRDGTYEDFDVNKVSSSIMGAAMEVAGEDTDTADNLADIVLDMLETNGIEKIDAADLQKIVEKALIEEGHAATATQYILKGADRSRMRDMDSSLMHSLEEITFTSDEDSEIKRENANIDSRTSMGVMLKYGSEAAKNFNLLYMMSEDIAEAHRNCDIHIHDLDFLTLTETCVVNDTVVSVKIGGEERICTVEELANSLNLVGDDQWLRLDDSNIEILSNGKYVKLNGIVKHPSTGKEILRFHTNTGDLTVTSDHVVTIEEDGKAKDVKAEQVRHGDILSIPQFNPSRYNLEQIDLINEYNKGVEPGRELDNLVIYNTDLVVKNVKDNGNWDKFKELVANADDYDEPLSSTSAKLTINLYKKIEHLVTLSHNVLEIQHVKSKNNETINAVLPLSYELGAFIGYMYSSGDFHTNMNSKVGGVVEDYAEVYLLKGHAERFYNIYNKIFNNAKYYGEEVKDSCTRVNLTGYLQCELFRGLFGKDFNRDEIVLADWMYKANKKFISGFIGGLLDGNGLIKGNGRVVDIISPCYNMLLSVQRMLLLRGITTSIGSVIRGGAGEVDYHERDGMLIKTVSKYNYYYLDFIGNVASRLGWVDSYKIKNTGLIDFDKDLENYNYAEVESIKQIDYNGYVYDLETEDSHFTANGFNVHNCLQIPLDKLFKGGFNTGHGFLREPGNIRTAGALAAIAIQSNQNDQHGGQSIPMFDYYLAPYVALTYVKRIAEVIRIKFDLDQEQYKGLKKVLLDYRKTQDKLLVMNDKCNEEMNEITAKYLDEVGIKPYKTRINKAFENAYEETYDETFQAMEAFIHNLNTMHCLPESESIWVEDGKTGEFTDITMGELYDGFMPGRYKVISINPKTFKAEFKEITSCKKVGNHRDLVAVVDKNGRKVVVTDNHRILTIDKSANIKEAYPEDINTVISPRGIKFPPVKYDICLDDYGDKQNTVEIDHVFVDEDFVRFAALLTATAYINKNKYLTFDLVNGDKTLRDTKEIDNIIAKAFKCGCNPFFSERKNKEYDVYLPEAIYNMLVDKFGEYGDKLPKEIMYCSDELKKTFLKQFINCRMLIDYIINNKNGAEIILLLSDRISQYINLMLLSLKADPIISKGLHIIWMLLTLYTMRCTVSVMTRRR